jgi:type IV secretory pathway VirJ component
MNLLQRTIAAFAICAGTALAQTPDAASPPSEVNSDSVTSLPLLEILSPDSSGETFAIMLSGDGGWSKFDQGVSESLAKRGIPVVGMNSLKYFWSGRTPETTAEDVARILRYYLKAWHRQRVILAGYSFGADVLPFVAARLPDDLRRRVALVAMIAPSHNADFEFHVAYWLHMAGKTQWLVLPEVQKLKGMNVLAVCEEKDPEALCTDLPADAAKMVILKGGHHFDHDYETIVQDMMDTMK